MTATTQPEHGKTANFATDPRLSTGTKNFLKVLNSAGGPPLETLAPIEARKVLEGAQASANVDVSGIAESERMIEADGMSIKLIVVRPENANGKLPAFMFFHGGGWVLGDYPTHKRIVRDLVVESGYPAVFVEYTRTPDAVYPRQVDELYAATKWVSEHGDEINVDGTKLAIVGNSVGGNMTAVTVIKAIENGGPKITSIVMMWPVTDTDQETDSYQQFGQDRYLTKSLMKWMFDLYLTKPEQWNDHHVAPLKTPTEILSKFPPALIQVSESDILLDEGEAFGRKLDAAGVEVTTIRYNGMIHDFGLLNPLADEPATRSLFRHAAAELKKRLG